MKTKYKKFIGYLIIISFWIGLGIICGVSIGFKNALLIFGTILLFIGIMWGAVTLIDSKDE